MKRPKTARRVERRRSTRRAVLVLFFAALLSTPSTAETKDFVYGVFPPSDEIFRRVPADPRQAQTSVRYYRSAGENMGDVALGNTWGLMRWSKPGDRASWTYQLSAEGMGYSRFLLSGGINEFQAIDFFLNIPLEVRRGRYSSRTTLFHESAHLGDDYIRRTGDRGFRYSVEGLGHLASLSPRPHLRVYGGGSVLLHQIPAGQDGTLQTGVELRTSDLHWNWLPDHECWIFLAQDFQWKGRADWRTNSKTVLGMRVGAERVVRAFRMHIGYFEGRSEFGQFFNIPEHFFDLGITFDF